MSQMIYSFSLHSSFGLSVWMRVSEVLVKVFGFLAEKLLIIFYSSMFRPVNDVREAILLLPCLFDDYAIVGLSGVGYYR